MSNTGRLSASVGSGRMAIRGRPVPMSSEDNGQSVSTREMIKAWRTLVAGMTLYGRSSMLNNTQNISLETSTSYRGAQKGADTPARKK
jgi:hypothetical protein